MAGLWLASLLVASSCGVTMGKVQWNPERSFWPEEEPKPEWWTRLDTSDAPEVEHEEAPHTSATAGESEEWATAAEAVRQMGRGINLGNTFDMPAYYPERLSIERNRRMIDLFVEKGFTSVRIPVTWDGHFDSLSVFTSRVSQAVWYALSRGLWVVINTHHEHWLKCCYNDTAVFNERFAQIWWGISTHFADADDHLIFEVLNEPEGIFGDWQKSPPPEAESGKILTRKICQVGLHTIRQVSPRRIVLCAPNAQGNLFQAGAVFRNESDFGGLYDEYVAITLHTYDPWDFCGQTGNNSYWSNATAMRQFFSSTLQNLTQWQNETGFSVHIGEYGVGRMEQGERKADIIREYYGGLTQAFASHGIPSTLWDDGGWFAVVSNFTWVHGLADAALGLSPDVGGATVGHSQDSLVEDKEGRRKRRLRAGRESDALAMLQGARSRRGASSQGIEHSVEL